MSKRCRNLNCNARCRTCSGYCQGCKSKRHHASKRIKRDGLIVDTVLGGRVGSWWVWDAKGEVLVIGRDSELEAFNALAFGETTEEITDGD